MMWKELQQPVAQTLFAKEWCGSIVVPGGANCQAVSFK